jgi:hypothetical protein
MPHSNLHKQKQKKNLAVLALIIGWIAIIFTITIIKIKNGG